MLLHDSAVDRVRALSWADLRRIRSDPAQLIVLTVLPIGMIAFLTPANRAQLRLTGYFNASGVEQSGPGTIVMFAFFITTLLGASFFREHEWGTWQRIRAAPVRAIEVIIGKSFPSVLFSVAQVAILWLVVFTLWDLHSKGSSWLLLPITASLLAATWGFGIALVSLCRTIDQLAIMAQVGSLAIGGLAGTITPRDTLPAWARALSPYTPQYWALKGYQDVILHGAGFSDIIKPCLILLAVGVAGGLVALFKFRLNHSKVGRS
ncbi:ABC transporter permease [Nocardia sp. NBC_01499]|uniref:ABC transporter permease n=1 Tax=Nocardia sp. NBC_01499 TaxID=2903597 RepID=UPI0038689040